ncbi:hypothetical protein C8J57DRAFT_1246273 [Mycena rebaudengoi]|nr:hypothetical protein C8J57DRAFT_1246273 [Mycena rebaudengoi]
MYYRSAKYPLLGSKVSMNSFNFTAAQVDLIQTAFGTHEVWWSAIKHWGNVTNLCVPHVFQFFMVVTEESPPEGTAKRAAGTEPTLPHNGKTKREEEGGRREEANRGGASKK